MVAYRSVSDGSAVKAYAALAMPAIESFGGRLLTGPANEITAHEAGVEQLTIIIEFESYDIARVAYKSDAYKEALGALGSGAECDFRIVEGV